MGASCNDDGECASNVCLEPFGSPAYCTIQCPAGNECPVGYSCTDTGAGSSLGNACYQSVCLYPGGDTADCVERVLDEADIACTQGCESQLETWFGCLEGAGLLCTSSGADAACGAQRGLLSSCCSRCDNDW